MNYKLLGVFMQVSGKLNIDLTSLSLMVHKNDV